MSIAAPYLLPPERRSRLDAGRVVRETIGAEGVKPFSVVAIGYLSGEEAIVRTRIIGALGVALAAVVFTAGGAADPVPPAPYTLQVLHLYGESGTLGDQTAPIMGALSDKFKTQYANTLTLAEGDTWIPGPWLVAGADPSLNAVPAIGATQPGGRMSRS